MFLSVRFPQGVSILCSTQCQFKFGWVHIILEEMAFKKVASFFTDCIRINAHSSYNEEHLIGEKLYEHYQVEENCCLIGIGTYGHVKKAVRRVDGRKVVVKEVQKSALSIERKENEASILRFLSQNNNTPELFDCFETPHSYCLVMDCLPGQTLHDLVKSYGPLEEKMAARIFRQLVQAVKDLQRSGVLHGDISVNNTLISFGPNDTMKLYLIDFSASTWYSPHKRYTDCIVSLAMTPPEWFIYHFFYAEPMSVWTLGVLLYSILFDQVPFKHENEITDGKVEWPENNF